MLTPDGPKVIEFNVRFGDPEAQVVLPFLEGQFAPHAARVGDERTLEGIDAQRRRRPARRRRAGLARVSRAGRDTGQPIDGLDRAGAAPGVLVFHAGTRAVGGRVVTAGGRVLTVVGRGPSYDAGDAPRL